MKKYREDLRTIAEVLIYSSLYLSFFTFKSSAFSYSLLGVWMIIWITNIYSKIRYRMGKSSYILFPTKNDEYTKITSIVLGTIILAGVISFATWTKQTSAFLFIGLVIGTLVLINGIIDLPKGRISIDNESILISGLQKKVSQKTLKQMVLSTESITLTTIENEVHRINNLAIDPHSARIILEYLSKNNRNSELQIVNQVS